MTSRCSHRPPAAQRRLMEEITHRLYARHGRSISSKIFISPLSSKNIFHILNLNEIFSISESCEDATLRCIACQSHSPSASERGVSSPGVTSERGRFHSYQQHFYFNMDQWKTYTVEAMRIYGDVIKHWRVKWTVGCAQAWEWGFVTTTPPPFSHISSSSSSSSVALPLYRTRNHDSRRSCVACINKPVWERRLPHTVSPSGIFFIFFLFSCILGTTIFDLHGVHSIQTNLLYLWCTLEK